MHSWLGLILRMSPINRFHQILCCLQRRSATQAIRRAFFASISSPLLHSILARLPNPFQTSIGCPKRNRMRRIRWVHFESVEKLWRQISSIIFRGQLPRRSWHKSEERTAGPSQKNMMLSHLHWQSLSSITSHPSLHTATPLLASLPVNFVTGDWRRTSRKLSDLPGSTTYTS